MLLESKLLWQKARCHANVKLKPELFSVARVIKKDIRQWLLQLEDQMDSMDSRVVKGMAQDHSGSFILIFIK